MTGNRIVHIFDTTLRDGEQAPGNEMSADTKIALFKSISETGVAYIEAGFPAASPVDHEVVSELARSSREVRVTAFARATAHDIDTALSALGGHPGTQLQILLTGSEVHAQHKRRMTVEEILKETREAVSYAQSCGVEDISLGLEDSSRGTPDYLRKVVDVGVEAGGTTVILADTVGQATPSEIATMVSRVRAWAGDGISISLHCHNDMGLATANTLAGIKAGADVVQTTFCGIGERTGNAAIEEVGTILHYKPEEFGASTTLDLARVAGTCTTLLDAIGVAAWKHKPVIGRYAFSTSAGIHASGLINAPITYEYVDPALFGRRREMLLNRMSGRANIRQKLIDYGLAYDDEHIDRMYKLFISDADPRRFNGEREFRELYQSALPVA